MEGSFLDHRDGHPVAFRGMIGSLVVDLHVVDHVAKPAFERRSIAGGLYLETVKATGDRSVGSGFEDDRSGVDRAMKSRGFERDTGGQVLGFEAQVTADVLAGDIEHCGVAVAAGNIDDFPLLRVVALDHRQGRGDDGVAAGDFETVGEIGAALLQLVADHREIFAVFGRGPLEDGIEPALVVVVGEVLPFRVPHRKHGIEWRAEFAAQHFEGEVFTLLRGEGEEVHVVRLADDTVGCARQFGELGRLLGTLVRLDLRCGGEWRDLDPERRGDMDAVA